MMATPKKVEATIIVVLYLFSERFSQAMEKANIETIIEKTSKAE